MVFELILFRILEGKCGSARHNAISCPSFGTTGSTGLINELNQVFIHTNVDNRLY